MTQQEQNKKIVEAYVKAFNEGNMDILRSLFAPDAEIQGVFGKGLMEKVMPVWEQLVTGLGMQLTIEGMVADGDTVAVRYTERGTFKGQFMGNQPTGKTYELTAMEWFVIENEKIKKRWGARDHAAQARQIGLPLQ
ncbi:ester cyclase [Pontibacter toksunensis]|uniref:Ester cyclase n=1 Tax=Pontibacter toksunensis TaxID=1332631 RepID=A0ABW6BWA3_9BACT